MKQRIFKKETIIPIQELSKEVECYYAQGPSYWILNKNGEIRSYGPLTAIMKLGPNIEISSTSILVPLGLNLLVCWYSLKAQKNHFVLFSKQMEYFSSLSVDVNESNPNLTLGQRVVMGFPFEHKAVDYVMTTRKSLYVDVFAANSGKLYLVKGNADITYGVDSSLL